MDVWASVPLQECAGECVMGSKCVFGGWRCIIVNVRQGVCEVGTQSRRCVCECVAPLKRAGVGLGGGRLCSPLSPGPILTSDLQGPCHPLSAGT